MSEIREFHSASARDTEALGAALGALLGAGDVVALDGELGGGKTCFVRGLARGLGISAPVSSPTFQLMHAYPGRVPLYHLDAWMRERGEGFLAEGGAEWLRADGVAAVEWAGNVRPWLPDARFEVELRHAGEDRRVLTLRWTGPGERLGALRAREKA
ncbi:MAG: tRNA (adenosine(37)-N6)-threonylcarbamoyltransferase complex ATPase subunit type 1 TsaE [Planctomycetota bacterium]